MIIELLLNLLYKVFSILTSVINIPFLPEEIYNFMNETYRYLETGVRILDNYIFMNYVVILFGIIISVDVGIMIYHFVMWIIRKIPMAGMS